jgi:hypothetical protein
LSESGPYRTALIATIGALAAVSGTSDAWAYRPFDGTDADVAELGSFELELGPLQWYSQGDSHYAVAPATVLNLGYLPGWELVADFQNFVGIDIPARQPRVALRDTDIFTKGILWPGSLQNVGSGPSIAAEFGPLLPEIHGEKGFGASCNVIVSERWAGVTIHVNNWFELSRGDLELDWFEGVIIEGNIDAPARPVSEWFVEHEFVANLTTYSGLVGGIWRASDALDLDAGLRVASVGGERTSEVRVGLTWTLPVWGGGASRGH